MFANLFFLILILLLISFATENLNSIFFPENMIATVAIAIVVLVFVLLLFRIQRSVLSQKFDRGKFIFLANIELILFFSFAFFFLGIQRLFLWPDSTLPFGNTLFSFFSLLTYFGCIAYAHYLAERPLRLKYEARKQSLKAVRFLIPFILPFLFFTALTDLFEIIPSHKFFLALGIEDQTLAKNVLELTLSIIFIILALIFLPPLIIAIWQCKPIRDQEIKHGLDEICQRAHFTHAGFRTWPVLEDSFTAAIVGIIGKFRYVMFTQKLLNTFPNTSIEAILAHEIGHSRYRHLLIYPWILFGMIVTGSIALSLLNYFPFSPAFEHWQSLASIALFITVAALYFRFIFGYFSRLFERQADLYVFELNVPGAHLVEALDQLGNVSGNIHLMPNWHHYSIQQRIDYIQKADNDRSLLQKHHRKFKLSLIIYFTLLIAALTYMFIGVEFHP